MNKLVIVILTLILTACSKETKNISERYQLPKELSDCKVYSMRAEGGFNITLVRCPNSSTTTSYTRSSGKSSSRYSNTVVEND